MPDAPEGRTRPPIAAVAPLAWFAVLALLLTAVIVVLVRPPGPQDQPDLAYQRDGLLLDGPRVDREVAGVRFGDRPVVVLFDRQPRDAGALAGWVAMIPDRAAVHFALPDEAGAAELPGRLQLAAGEHDVLADAVELPPARDGRPGIGYAVVDSDRVVRYSTLDPSYLDNAFEVATIVGSVP